MKKDRKEREEEIEEKKGRKDKVSISSTFYACFFRKYYGAKHFKAGQSAFVQNFGTKNTLSYEKRTQKLLMKLTQGESHKGKEKKRSRY